MLIYKTFIFDYVRYYCYVLYRFQFFHYYSQSVLAVNYFVFLYLLL